MNGVQIQFQRRNLALLLPVFLSVLLLQGFMYADISLGPGTLNVLEKVLLEKKTITTRTLTQGSCILFLPTLAFYLLFLPLHR